MIFLDTSFLVALELEKDENHADAAKINNEIIYGKYGSACISDYVFDEVVTLTLARTHDLAMAVKIGNNLKISVEFILLNESTLDDSWVLFCKQKTKRLSFTDCTTISLMKANNMRNIATFDKEFERIKGIHAIK